MSELESKRLKKVAKYLIGLGYAPNERELAIRLGYTRSSFSLIVNARRELSDRFLNKLCELHPWLNREWILSGQGQMLLTKKQANKQVALSESTDENEKEETREEKDKANETLVKMLAEKEKMVEGQRMIIGLLTDRVLEMERQVAQLEEKLSSRKGDGQSV